MLLAALTFAGVWAIGFGYRTWGVARAERRDPARWAVLGAILGPAALMILEAAPPGTCGSCLSPVTGWSFTCPTCGADVRLVQVLLPTTEVGADPIHAARVDVAPEAAVDWPEWSTASAWRTTPSPASTMRATPAPNPARVASLGVAEGEDAVDAAAAGLFEAAVAAAAARPAVMAATDAGETASGPAVTPAGVPVMAPGVDDAASPVRLALAVFVEGSRSLRPGRSYQLVSRGRELQITGALGGPADREVVSEPIDEVRVSVRGNRMLVSGTSEALADLRLVFTKTEDLTERGVARQVNAMRRRIATGAAKSGRP